MSNVDGLPDVVKDLRTEDPVKRAEQITQTPEAAVAIPENLQADLAATNLAIETQEGIVANITDAVNEIRHNLGLEGEDTDIPSVEPNRQRITELDAKRAELERRLQEVLASDVSEKYRGTIEEVRKSKIDWANSEELARRLKLKGITDEEVLRVRDLLVDNAINAKTFILPSGKFAEVVDILHEITGQENLKEGDAFYSSRRRTDVPEEVKNSLFMKEKPPLPPIPGKEKPKETIDVVKLHHELGHATEDGVLDSGLYADWQAKTKKDAPDGKYIGLIKETDVRIRAMFRDLIGLFDPHKERFTSKHLELLKEKLKKGEVSSDTRQLLAHYDDDQIIEHANNLPAI